MQLKWEDIPFVDENIPINDVGEGVHRWCNAKFLDENIVVEWYTEHQVSLERPPDNYDKYVHCVNIFFVNGKYLEKLHSTFYADNERDSDIEFFNSLNIQVEENFEIIKGN